MLSVTYGADEAAPTAPQVRQGAASQPAATAKPPSGASPETVEKFVQYYLSMYEKHLRSRDWMARAMGVISLARIDDPRTTERLMRVMRADKAMIVRAYAWEALHARQDRLTPKQWRQWSVQAFELTKRNALRGDLRIGVIGLLDAEGPTARNKKLVESIFASTNSLDPSDIRTLQATGDMIARWQSPDIIKTLIGKMDVLNDAYRAELILHRITDEIPLSYQAPALPAASRGQPWYKWLRQEGSTVMWSVTQKRWNEWFRKQQFREIDCGQGGPYKGLSNIMPRGEKIQDPSDPKWRKDLELRRFSLNQLEVGFAVDSTASMGPVIRWIQRDVAKMMRAFTLISREPRIGVTLYRDHGDEYLVKNIHLTDNARQLTQQLRDAKAKGGGDIPEAVYAALYSLLKKEQWTRQADRAKKAIILVGDAPPHKHTLGKIEALAKDGVKKGFVFHCVKVRTHHAAIVKRHLKKTNYDPRLATFDQIAQWGGGSSIEVNVLRSLWRIGTAQPNTDTTPERRIFRNLLRSLLENAYHDRVDPFINVLLEYVEAPLSERRQPFGPGRRGRPWKYRDPQEDR